MSARSVTGVRLRCGAHEPARPVDDPLDGRLDPGHPRQELCLREPTPRRAEHGATGGDPLRHDVVGTVRLLPRRGADGEVGLLDEGDLLRAEDGAGVFDEGRSLDLLP